MYIYMYMYNGGVAARFPDVDRFLVLPPRALLDGGGCCVNTAKCIPV